MKTFAQIFVALLSLLLAAGCSNERASKHSTLVGVQDVIYATKQAWVAKVKAEYAAIEKLPADEQAPLRASLAARREQANAIAAEIDVVWKVEWERAKEGKDAHVTANIVQLVNQLKSLAGVN